MSEALVAIESGTFPGSSLVSSSTRAIRLLSDDHKTQDSMLMLGGMVSGAQSGLNLDDFVTVARGGSGTLAVNMVANGYAPLLSAVLGAPTIATPMGATDARTFTWTSAANPTAVYLRTQIGREKVDGTLDKYRYGAGTGTQLAFAQQTGDGDAGALKVTTTMDYARAVGTATGTYPAMTGSLVAPGVPFFYSQCSVDVFDLADPESPVEDTDGCKNEYNLTVARQLKTDEYCLDGTGIKDAPYKTAAPNITGTLNWRYRSSTYYDRFRAGEPMKVVVTYSTGVEIESGQEYSLVITINRAVATGDDPVAPLMGNATQAVPFTAAYDSGVNALEVVLTTADTAQ